ncbi:MAG: FAD-dependent oxidoreductase [Spirochaetales bacterium]|nr:FAD-dependent oxidoreductase [Spirochaetales bacterium]
MDKKGKQEILKFLSHQLKSPINTIETLLHVISENYSETKDSKTWLFIQKAIHKAKEARDLITELTNYEKFKVMGGNADEELELTILLESIVNQFHGATTEKNINLVFNVNVEADLFMKGNRASLEEAFKNLVDNAIKYSREKGTVTIKVEANIKKKSVTIAIKDKGIGIEKEEIDKIFEPFYRSPKRKSSTTGFGLGLPIVKSIIEYYQGKIRVESRMGEGSTFIVQLPLSHAERRAKEKKLKKRVVIIGGVTAGPKAAARLRRLDEEIEILIIEKSEFLSYAGCGLPSYISGRVNSPKALMSTADNTLRDVYFFEAIKNIKIMNRTEATKINREAKTVEVKDLDTGRISMVLYDILVLATGAESIVPSIHGIHNGGIYSLYKIEDAENIKKVFASTPACDVYIIGGGLIGVETAESLMSIGARVTILEKDAHILKLFDTDIAEKIEHELSKRGVKIITGINIKKITSNNERHTIKTDLGDFSADLIILSTGVKPNSRLGVKAGLEIGKMGGIRVDEYLKTSDENIYAIGDCAESKNLLTGKYAYLPLGSISTKMGRIAADNIFGTPVIFPGNIGTTMFKIFDVSVGRTGLELETAREAGYDPETVIVAGLDRSHYYPDAGFMVLKLMADKKSQILLGAQGYGRGELILRIEVLACAIANHMTLESIFKLDLGYYPAFNNPIDILQTGCNFLKGKIEGCCRTISPREMDREKDRYTIINLSPVAEHEINSIPDSVNIPLENLRIESLPFEKNRPIVLYSRTSSRAYEAYRYLAHNGFTNLRILEGGLIFYGTI